MELVDIHASNDYALQCIKWCAENRDTAALGEHLRLHKNKLKDELILVLFDAFSERRTEVISIMLASLDEEIRTMNRKDGKTCLHKLFCNAVAIGETGIVKDLIGKGAKLNVNGFYHGKPLLHIAACYGHSEIVTELIKADADIHIKDKNGDGIIHSILTSQLANKGPIVEQVITLGADPLVKTNSGKLPIHLAAKSAADVLVELIRGSDDVNIPDDINKETPLHIACGTACSETILTLIQYGSRFNVKNNYGQTPLAKLLRFTHSEHDFHTKTRIQIAKVLISIGFRMSCQKTSTTCNKGRDKCYDRYISLKISMKTPLRLQSLARAKMRESFTQSSSFQKKINKLDIPMNLKSFLMFHDLEL